MAQLPDQNSADQNSADQYSMLAADLRAGNVDAVAGFGSNDCPTWTSVYSQP